MNNGLDVWLARAIYDERVRRAEKYWRRQELLANALPKASEGQRTRLASRVLSVLGLHLW